uniref:Motilin receptor n=1 Tax=Rhinopithecus bieti TaxID=61621 RepID=A0A2K6MXA1_RHIBE
MGSRWEQQRTPPGGPRGRPAMGRPLPLADERRDASGNVGDRAAHRVRPTHPARAAFDLYASASRPWVFGSLLRRLSGIYGGECTYATLLHHELSGVEAATGTSCPALSRARVSWQDPGISVVPGLNGTAQLAPSPPASSPPLWLSRAPPPSPPSGPETAEAAALFSRECRPSPAQLGALRVMLWVTTAYFFLPFLCLSILYGLIGRELWSSRRPLRGPAASGRERGHRQTVRVLLVVVLAFIVCWLPFHVGRIIYINTEDLRMMYFSQYFNIVALQLFYLSASINPILYNLISKKYRAAACKLLLARKSRPTGLHRSRDTAGEVAGDTGGDTAGYTETSANMKTTG